MAYCILRFKKIKSRVSLVRAFQHNARDRQPGNADPERTKYNEAHPSADALARLDALMPQKIRKNAVLAVEAMLTLSPEAFGDLKGQERAKAFQMYLVEARKWAAKQLGGDKNILQIAYHRDELTPHVHLIMMPLKDGKLNARAYIGGTRDRLKELQDNFYKEVGQKFGLDRGLPRTQTNNRHNEVRDYYKDVDQVVLEKRRREAALREQYDARVKKSRDDALGR